ncbi:hypothetical protein LJK87_43165 [Paenibacillus sp. P25]|nr:hypothetical protein LJK87_43165 [Paenibacillus sp. P25]
MAVRGKQVSVPLEIIDNVRSVWDDPHSVRVLAVNMKRADRLEDPVFQGKAGRGRRLIEG